MAGWEGPLHLYPVMKPVFVRLSARRLHCPSAEFGRQACATIRCSVVLCWDRLATRRCVRPCTSLDGNLCSHTCCILEVSWNVHP